jgi:phosphoadenosine phosphosulfate reductase
MTAQQNHHRALAARLNSAFARHTDLRERIVLLTREVAGRLVLASSLGLEDQVLLDAVTRADRDQQIDTFTLDTGRHFPNTLELLSRSEAHFDRRIRVYAPQAQAVEELVARDGIQGFRLSVEARKACCAVRKVEPLQRALAGATAWITGLRRGQSSGRADVPFAEWDDAHGLVKVNPIADWSLDDVEDYVRRHDVPVSALHAQGFPSVGCQPCTRAIRPGEDIRAGRWWWENENGKECGLHKSPTRRLLHRPTTEEVQA